MGAHGQTERLANLDLQRAVLLDGGCDGHAIAAVMWLPVAAALLLVVQALWALVMLGTAVTFIVRALNGTPD